VSASVNDRRPAELVASLASIRTRLTDAATDARRDPWTLTLVAVTKTFPASDIAILLGLGVFDIGESRDQEVRAKLAQLQASESPDPHTGGPTPAPRVHFIGRLQTNKCRSVARYADCVHTVDRLAVATALADGVESAGRAPLPVFVQVSLDGDPARGGVARAELDELVEHVAADARLRLLGPMAVAPLDQSPASAYEALQGIAAQIREVHPGAVSMSAGMSDDFEVAIKFGATHVRIGSALLGHRAVTIG
jgi:PLP dependent protein